MRGPSPKRLGKFSLPGMPVRFNPAAENPAWHHSAAAQSRKRRRFLGLYSIRACARTFTVKPVYLGW